MSQATAPQAATRTAPPTPDSPPARRLTLARWRDPRLWVGVVLVASSVLVGGHLLADADDSVGVWAAARDISAGTVLSRDDLAVAQVHFRDDSTLQQYLPTGGPLPAGVLRHDLSAGELLPSVAVESGRRAPYELPVVVDAAGAPQDIGVGDVVDVWVAPAVGSGSTAPARRMLTSVPVVAATGQTGPFGDAATRQVLLGLERETVDLLGPALGQMSNGSVVLVRLGDAP